MQLKSILVLLRLRRRGVYFHDLLESKHPTDSADEAFFV